MQSTIIASALLALMTTTALAQVPEGYPAEYQEIIDEATDEGSIIIYAPFDKHEIQPLMDAFSERFPGISFEYNDLSTPVIYNRFISEVAAGGSSADFLWSSAMDLQVKLADDGFAMQYEPVEGDKFDEALKWDNMIFTVVNEPMCWIYNKNILTEEQVPTSHADLVEKFREYPDVFKGKLVSYDIEKSGVGFFSVALDDRQMADGGFWELAKGMNETGVRFLGTSGAMVEAVSSGEAVFGYNVTCGVPAYAAKNNPNLGIIFPEDFTTVAGRVALIPEAAQHPNAAKLFLDFLLSAEGQQIMATTPGLYSARDDVNQAGIDIAAVRDRMKPVALGPDLLFNLDQAQRLEFLNRWKEAFGG